MISRHTISIKNAWNGLIVALKTQPNYKIHFFLSVLAVLLGFVLKISYIEFLIITALIFTGFAFETVNTAIEEATDAIDKEWREDIKLAKDTAAGAMLVFAMGAFVIGAIIFVPKIINLLG